MALGLIYGRTDPGAPIPGMFETSAALHDHIKARYGATCCRVLTHRFPSLECTERTEHCIAITGEVAARVAERLAIDGPLQ